MRVTWLAVVLLAACGSRNPAATEDAASPVVGAFAIDVIEQGGGVAVYLAPAAAPCCESIQTWPGEAACAEIGKGSACSCSPWGCVTDIRVERAGAVIDTTADGNDGTFPWRSPYFFGVDLGPGPVEVVVEGCGGVERIPIAHALTGTLRELRFRSDGDELAVDWVADPTPTHVVAQFVVAGAGEMCTSLADGTAEVHADGAANRTGELAVQPLALESTRAGVFGDVRVWHAGTGHTVRAYSPVVLPDGRWSLPSGGYAPALHFQVTDATETGERSGIVEAAAMEQVGDEMWVDFAGLATGFYGTWTCPFAFRSGATVDDLTLTFNEGVANVEYAATIPHLRLIDAETLGTMTPVIIVIDTGTITMHRVDDPAITRDVSLFLVWDIGIIPALP
jgi:hypothetical protein